MQPGKPQGFGHVGDDRTPIFTLPGNPVSSYVSFEQFVLPAIRKLMGRTPYARPTVRGPAHPRDLLPGRVASSWCGRSTASTPAAPYATPVGGHGSHLIGDLASSNALVVVPADVTAVAAGEQVQVLRLDEEF